VVTAATCDAAHCSIVWPRCSLPSTIYMGQREQFASLALNKKTSRLHGLKNMFIIWVALVHFFAACVVAVAA
jgi:hypothetical protein